ncbi:MAG: NAD-dependent malic enzyme, partial [Gammaproteobacteria bacterium]|nr:NAD-dependent malic enzyme [Gammaproteobacteria bacterium]
HIRRGMSLRDYSIECSSTEHAQQVLDHIKQIKGVTVESISDETFLMHLGGKLEIVSKVPLKTRADLSMVYTPGVARVCQAVHHEYRTSFNLTIRKNCIAVVSDGSAVLGLGNIGAAAAMPVMEGKAILFKEFGQVDAFPLCVDTQDPENIIDFCRYVAPTFGGINLEDISAPRCFYIEERLNQELDIPVFHDDQHGTAVVVLAGLMNALKLTDKKPGDLKVVIAGAGAAGIACAKALRQFGVGNLVVCDRRGAIYAGRQVEKNAAKKWVADNTNPDRERGALTSVISGADLLLGLAAPGILSSEDIKKMNSEPIVFAMSNPIPEVMPEEIRDLAAVIATGRSDYPNQINNVLAFPGIFRGALDTRASEINAEMKQAAALAIADVITKDELSPEYIIPSAFNKRVVKQVAAAVARAAHKTHVARRVPKSTNVYPV